MPHTHISLSGRTGENVMFMNIRKILLVAMEKLYVGGNWGGPQNGYLAFHLSPFTLTEL